MELFQFPVMSTFSMTINRSQSQIFEYVELNLPNECFTYGQLYVVLSRRKNPN